MRIQYGIELQMHQGHPIWNGIRMDHYEPPWITLGHIESDWIRTNPTELVQIILTSRTSISIKSAWFMLIVWVMGNHYESP